MSTFESINVVNGQQADAAAASGSPLRIAGTYNSTQPTLTTGEANSLQVDVNANLKTVLENGIASGTAGTPSANVITTQPIAGTSYTNTVIVAATPALVTVKSTSGQMFDFFATNFTSAGVFIHFFDISGSVSIGTTAATFVWGIPGNTAGAGVAMPLKIPRGFANAIKYVVSGGPALIDNTNIGTTGVIVDLVWL
jgi:hypothetical protein